MDYLEESINVSGHSSCLCKLSISTASKLPLEYSLSGIFHGASFQGFRDKAWLDSGNLGGLK